MNNYDGTEKVVMSVPMVEKDGTEKVFPPMSEILRPVTCDYI